MKYFLIACFFFVFTLEAAELFVEAESFANKGGWVVDQQFMDQMGSPYLMAHGIGKPVADAMTTVEFPETGTYQVFVRTFNWTSPWYKGNGPGQFQLKIDGKPLPATLGSTGEQWMWQNAGKVNIRNRKTELALHDLTGYNGRCDAIYFTKDASSPPPSETDQLSKFRRSQLGITVKEGGKYEFIVVGGGAAGICAAVAAARLGVKVALINNRPVLGGNNSSEVRVGLSGDIDKNLYPNIGNVLKEFNPKRPDNAGPAEEFIDAKKEAIVRDANVDLFLNMHVFDVEM